MSALTITLDGDTDWPGFRREARALLARQVQPDDVTWHTRASAAEDLFASADDVERDLAGGDGADAADASRAAPASNSAVVPPAFLRLCETVVLHEDPDRFGLLYRLLWRMVHEPGLRGDPLDADRVQALAELREATDRCRECPIGQHATQSVFGEGPVGAALMVVGEQPGDHEDLRGRPFVGPAGQLFDRAIAQLGWPRDRLYVTNAVKHFKFELRGQRRIHKTPAQQEAAACLHWLESEMAQVRPRAVIALGATAARALLGRPVAVMRERGQWHTGARGEQVLVTLHPSALLRGEPAQFEAAFGEWLRDLAMAAPADGNW